MAMLRSGLKYAFGIDQEKLNEIVDEIHTRMHAGNLCPQSVEYKEVQGQDDYTIKTITLTYAGAARDQESGVSSSG